MDDKTGLNRSCGILAKYPHIARMQSERDELDERINYDIQYYSK